MRGVRLVKRQFRGVRLVERQFRGVRTAVNRARRYQVHRVHCAPSVERQFRSVRSVILQDVHFLSLARFSQEKKGTAAPFLREVAHS